MARFKDVPLPSVSLVDLDAMLADPDFRIAADQHRKAHLNRHGNITVSRNKVGEIRRLIDQNLNALNQCCSAVSLIVRLGPITAGRAEFQSGN